MGQFVTWRVSLLLVLVLVMELAKASNLKWVPASNGNVPPYAVVGGEDFSGQALYVARIRIQTRPTPAKMAPSTRVAVASFGGKQIKSSDYDILTNPGWQSHLEWRKRSAAPLPENAVIGGYERDGSRLGVGRIMYVDGHMIPGKANQRHGPAVGYNNKELIKMKEWYVLVEHPAWYVRKGISKRAEFS